MTNSHFARVPKAELPRSSFDRSFSHKTTFGAGKLVPVFLDEVLPGDTFNLRTNMFVRLASPLSVPIMDDMYIDIQFFYVPNRILWDGWKRLQGEQRNPGEVTDILTPVVEVVPVSSDQGVLIDYFGLLHNYGGGWQPMAVSCLPFRAYNLIWNEWYRDENLQDRAVEYFGDDTAGSAEYYLLPRGKRHDYFTSCLPWPQKGPGVEIEIGGTVAVNGLLNQVNVATFPGNRKLVTYTDPNRENNATLQASGIPTNAANYWDSSIEVTGNTDHSKTGLTVDLSSATPITINALREAVQMQRLLERDARGGTRYTEMLKAHFGVIAPDASLQRPEYLGGFSQPITVNAVAKTASDGNSPQANLAAYAVSGSSGSGFVRSFTEHGVIMGLASVRANLTYQQGVNRMWFRRSRYDYYMPVLAHLGEQAVLQREIFCNAVPAEDMKVFGYQERYAEYRYKPSMITGGFRSDTEIPLDIWHLSQYFENGPRLNSEFIEERPPIERVSAVNGYWRDQFLADFYFQLKTVRVMPVYSVPGLMDHF